MTGNDKAMDEWPRLCDECGQSYDRDQMEPVLYSYSDSHAPGWMCGSCLEPLKRYGIATQAKGTDGLHTGAR